ncbi:MAG: T9SS type A sorting domain-containing protein [Flavobacteriales bacterium]|nr:T9SS type A sorting domain-containing protein [Flavobacteriales bacterium]
MDKLLTGGHWAIKCALVNLPVGFHEINTELFIINMQGQEVARQSLSPSSFIAPVQVDVSKLASGVYTVHWVDGSKWYDSVKLIKQ